MRNRKKVNVSRDQGLFDMSHPTIRQAIKEAKELDKKYGFFITINEHANGRFPVAIKDNICIKDMPTTAGSRILNNYVPVFDATIVKKLKNAGAAIIGKTAMDEFGFGTFSVNCAYKIPKNPHDPKRSCGGSSGGSAGYIAASRYSRFAIGQSTGGSITCPAAFCGVVGLTPTYGLVSRYGLIDYANSLDKIGVLAKTVYDAASCLKIVAGHDEMDSTTFKMNADYISASRGQLKIGVPKEYLNGVNERITAHVWRAIKRLEQAGYEYKEISLPYTKYALPAYYIIALSETSTNLAKFCGLRYGLSKDPEQKGFSEYFSEIRTEGFGAEAKRRIMLGTFLRMVGFRAQYYLKAMKIRTLIIQEFKRAFKTTDVLVVPSMPMIAPKFSEIKELKPIEHYMCDILTVSPNIAGIPQLSVPCGRIDRMPIGIQLLADHFQEQKIIQMGLEVEKHEKGC